MNQYTWTSFTLRIAIYASLVAMFAAIHGCAATPKRLTYGQYESRAMHIDMAYSVYTPPNFSQDEHLPLVLFLHGGGDSPDSFDQHEIGQRLDAAIARGDIPRVVVVLPEGDLGFWANWRDGTRYYEDWVIEELLPFVRETFHTEECPAGCHVMGVSMGGAGTLRFMFHHPELFASAGIISAPIMSTNAMLEFSNDRLMKLLIPTDRIWGTPARTIVEQEDPFLRWRSDEDVGMRLYLAWAEGDRGMIVTGNERLHQHLDDEGVTHGFEQFAGGHNWESWGPVIERAIAYGVRGDGGFNARAEGSDDLDDDDWDDDSDDATDTDATDTDTDTDTDDTDDTDSDTAVEDDADADDMGFQLQPGM